MVSIPVFGPVTYRAGLNLVWAFIERQTNLWRRYWAWEMVWLAYGAVNTLAITFIADEVGRTGFISDADVSQLVLFLLIGTLVWAYLSAVLDDVSLVITWERWEGTIEHTLIAPVPRALHLLGMALFGVIHAIARTLLIFLCVLPFFTLDLGNADLLAATLVIVIGSLSIVGVAIYGGILPLLYPERGPQMSFMMQAVILLVSGVYYSVDVLPSSLQALSVVSPATYILNGMRDSVIEGKGVSELRDTLLALLAFGVFLVPTSIYAFSRAEAWAKRTGKLKRQG